MAFSKSTLDQLQYYVYTLVDPRNNEVFYVGKASANNRAFKHLDSDRSESAKEKRIAEIRSAKLEPKIDILRHGLSDNSIALEIEAAVIDAIGIENLTNIIRGHDTDRGRLSAQAIESLYGSQPIKLEFANEPYMLFFIQNSFSPTMSEIEIYDCTRQFWHQVGEEKRKNLEYNTALAIVDSVVVRAYSICGWFPAGSTFSTRKFDGKADKWEFVGQIISSHLLLNKMLFMNGKKLPANQKGYGYVKPKEIQLVPEV